MPLKDIGTFADIMSLGDHVTRSKTMTETDLALFAAVSGDFDPIHMNEAYARETPFGGRIAHGLLSMALLSAASAAMSALARDRGYTGTSVSLGFDRVRFLAPVFIGDTLSASYEIETVDIEKGRTRSTCAVTKSDGTQCVAATHVMRWLDKD